MLTILVGKSGAGKDSILNKLIEKGFTALISDTTRPMREGEKDGREYHFVSEEEFLKNKDDYLEYRKYNTLVNGNPATWYYGSPKTELDKDKDYVIILELEGAKRFVDHYGKENCFVTYLDIQADIQKQRCENRAGYDETEFNRRFLDDNIVFSKERVMDVSNVTLSNNGNIYDTLKDFDILYNFYKQLEIPDGKHIAVALNYEYDTDSYYISYMDVDVYKKQQEY